MKPNVKTNLFTGFWPIPESFWPDPSLTILVWCVEREGGGGGGEEECVRGEEEIGIMKSEGRGGR